MADTECPYCGSGDDCPHLLAVFDITFGECNGGHCFNKIPEVTEAVEEAFRKALSAENLEDVSWGNYYLDETWQTALTEYSGEPKDLLIDQGTLLGLFAELLEENGATLYDTYFEGGPGMSSALQILYAEDPKAVYANAEGQLRDSLAPIS